MSSCHSTSPPAPTSLKAQALRLAGMASVLNSPEDSGFFMLKYFVGRRLSCLRTEWLSLRDNSAPSAVFPTPFYEACPLSHPRQSYIVSSLRLTGQGFLWMVTALSSGIHLLRILRMMLFG